MNIFKQLASTRCGFNGGMKSCRATCVSLLHSSSGTSVEVHSQDQEVVIALGSNVGNRVDNFNEALQLMKKSGMHITRHGCLYETEPVYVTDQPLFLNSAVRGITKLGPHELLRVLKKIEKDMGRTDGIRYGPRPIDLDILFYGKFRVNSEILTIPHERIWERPFVMAPLMDVMGSAMESDTNGLKRVLPTGNVLWDWSLKTSMMGILNLTPDSFSDGGKFQSVEAAVSQVRLMILEGADIIDIGAQSTRPMASRLSAQEELDRLIPVLDAVLKMPEVEGKLLSVDTFHSEVASEAIGKGAHIVNDVSAGQLDPNMLDVVASLKVPYVAMHMRGNPSTMQNSENLQYDNVCEQVASELYLRVRDAELSGIPAWRIIIDPGIGFSKNTEHNLDILMGLPNIRMELAGKSLALSHAPMLIGPSRKRFLGDICARPAAAERDPATIAAVTAGVLGGANIVRAHNVKDNLDAVKLCDAMVKRERSQA
ncbi:unnamed protein product, partial [Vitis vinifera]